MEASIVEILEGYEPNAAWYSSRSGCLALSSYKHLFCEGISQENERLLQSQGQQGLVDGRTN